MKCKYCNQTWWHQSNSCITFYYSDIGASIPNLRFQLTCIPIALPWSQLLIPHCYRGRIVTKTKNVSSHLEMQKNSCLMCSNYYQGRLDGTISWFPLIKAIEYCAQQITSKTTSSAVFTMKYKYCSQTWWHQRNSCITLYYSDIGASIPGLRFLFTCIPIALPWSQLLIPHCYRDRIATKTKTVSSHLEMQKNSCLMCSNYYQGRLDGTISWFPLIKAIEYCAQSLLS